MQITYTATEDDLVAAALLFMRRKGQSLRFVPWVGVFLLVYLAFQIVAGRHDDGSPVVARFAGVFALGTMLVCFPLLIRSNLRRQYRRTPVLFERRDLQADFSGLHFRSESSSSDVAWSVYVGFAEDERNFILLQQGNLIFIPIPKRELTPEQIESVRSVFDTYLPGS